MYRLSGLLQKVHSTFSIRRKITFILPFLVCFTILLFPVSPVFAATRSSQDLDALKNQLNDVQNKLNDIKKQKEQVDSQINNEYTNQSKLQNDTKYLDAVKQRNDLQISNLKLELDKLDLEISISQEEQGKAQKSLEEMQDRIKTLNNEMQETANLLYKMTLSSPTFLERDTSFEDSMVSQEKTKSLVQLLKTSIAEVKTLESEALQKKNEIDQKAKELADLQNQKKAQTENLAYQQQGLELQKLNKLSQIEQSKQKQQDLSKQQETIKQQINEYEQKLSELRNALYLLPPSGAQVRAGDIIGFQGRSGLNCDLIQPGVVRTNTYCQTLAGLSSEWYYYDPVAYPTKGNHLHFEYRVNNAPQTQAWLNGTGQKPLDKFTVTQGFHQGGAFDISNYFQAPVYAIKPGKIQYYCDSFPNDPAYGAIIYHDDGTKSQYWHMQRKPGSPPCKPL